MKKRVCLSFFLCGVLLLVCGAADAANQFIAGDDHSYPPFAFLDDQGQPAGFNVDLSQAVANVLGWDLEIRLNDWANTKRDLGQTELDFVTGMFYSATRTDEFAFTTRHSVASGDIFTRKETPIAGLEELRGKRVVVQADDIVHEFLQEQGLELEFRPVATVAQALRMVASGQEDYAAVLLIPGHYALHEYELTNVQSNNLQLGPFDYCFAVAKDNTALKVMLDEGLQIVKATGKYDEIYNKWLGVYEQKEAVDWAKTTKALIITAAIAALAFIWALILQQMVRHRTADLTRVNRRLERSREDLFYANEELRATIQQLTATSNQLAVQYEQLQEMEAALAEEKDLLRTTLLSVGEGVIVTDRFGVVVMINPVAEKMMGWPEQSAIGRHCREIFPGEHGQVVEQVMYTENILEIPELNFQIDGKEMIVACTIAPIQDQAGVVRGAVAVVRDISESVQQRKEIEYLSFHDPLTGLLNRRGFNRELSAYDCEEMLPLAVIVADVNGLKMINDTFGHLWGDELLVKVANILESALSRNGLVARLGGDEFAVLLPKTNRKQAEAKVLELSALAEQKTVQSVQISIAFGVDVKEKEEQNLQDCFNRAEERMYAHKMSSDPYRNSVDLFITALFEKSEVEREHSYRVASLAKIMGEVLGLSPWQINELYTIGLLHDVGKITVEESIIHKQGALTAEEWDEMKRHPEFGYRILRGAKDLENVARTILAHHEHFDGEGYPKQLAGEEIPLQARIIAIVDAYDAMTKKSFYRLPLSKGEAIAELRAQAGSQFDPDLVEVFIEQVIPRLEEEKEGTNKFA